MHGDGDGARRTPVSLRHEQESLRLEHIKLADARNSARRRQRELALARPDGGELNLVPQLAVRRRRRADADERQRAAGQDVAAVEQEEDAGAAAVEDHVERLALVHRDGDAPVPEGAHGDDGVRGVFVQDVVVEQQAEVGAAVERAAARRVRARRLVAPPLGVADGLRAAARPELAGSGHGGEHLLQRPAPDVADGLVAARAFPAHDDAAGAARGVAVLALHTSTIKHQTNAVRTFQLPSNNYSYNQLVGPSY